MFLFVQGGARCGADDAEARDTIRTLELFNTRRGQGTVVAGDGAGVETKRGEALL